MINLLRADCFKLRKTRAVWGIAGIAALSAALMAALTYRIASGETNLGGTGIEFFFSDANVVGILGGVIAGVVICADLENKTIHGAVAGGHGRLSVLLVKAVICFGVVALVLLPYAVAAVLALVTGADFGTEATYLGFFTLLVQSGGESGAAWGHLLAAEGTLAAMYIAQVSLCVPLALGLRRPVAVLAVFYGVSFGCARLSVLAERFTAFGRVFALIPFDARYAVAGLEMTGGDMARLLAVSAGFTVLMLVCAFGLFRRAELN